MCLGHPCSFLHLFCFAFTTKSDSSPMKICDPIFVSPKKKLICILTYNKFLNNYVSICHLCTTNSQQDWGDVGRKQQKCWKEYYCFWSKVNVNVNVQKKLFQTNKNKISSKKTSSTCWTIIICFWLKLLISNTIL